jgi:hypothetical protein
MLCIVCLVIKAYGVFVVVVVAFYLRSRLLTVRVGVGVGEVRREGDLSAMI